VSWVAQRGKCRGCSAPISPAYPLIELAAFGVAVWAWLAVPAAVFAATCVMGWLLLALSAIDMRTRRLPDVLNLLLAVSGIAVTAMIDTSLVVTHLAAAAVGYGALVAVELAYRHLRGRDGLGRGDSETARGDRRPGLDFRVWRPVFLSRPLLRSSLSLSRAGSGDGNPGRHGNSFRSVPRPRRVDRMDVRARTLLKNRSILALGEPRAPAGASSLKQRGPIFALNLRLQE